MDDVDLLVTISEPGTLTWELPEDLRQRLRLVDEFCRANHADCRCALVLKQRLESTLGAFLCAVAGMYSLRANVEEGLNALKSCVGLALDELMRLARKEAGR